MLRRGLLARCPGQPAATAAAMATAPAVARGAQRAVPSFEVGSVHNGFTFIRQRDFPELHMSAFEFVHNKTRTPYFHFDSDDTNNAFCIGFCTPAMNDKGTTHVLEHTVLCGSERYPVRDPFFLMLRRSMSTFMNAMTGADYTLYPFSTTNAKDFQNLLGVYLDAVLRPLLRAEDFAQEGHRLEVVAADSEGAAAANAPGGEEMPGAEAGGAAVRKVQFNGVVYNEMRGVVSEPAVSFIHALNREMLPGTHYEHVSGGYPTAILELTHEELRRCHQLYYHPSNALVTTYGDLHPEASMRLLDEYFSSFEPRERVAVGKLDPARRRSAPRRTETTGPLDVMGEPSRQMRVTQSFAVPDELDTPENLFAMSVLSELLTSGPSSPMYKALIESQLGSKFAPMTGYTSWTSTPLLSFGLEGVDQQREGVDREIASRVTQALQEVVHDGFDQRRVDSTVFQEELQQRHRSSSYGTGLTTSLIAFGLVKPHLDVLDLLNWLPHLKRIAADPKQVLCPLLEKAALSNPHASTLVVKADEKHLDTLRADLESREAELTTTLSDTEKDGIAADAEKWLERVRAPPNADLLPTLTVADIPPKGVPEPTPVQAAERLHLIPASTNGLVYVHALVPMFRPFLGALREASVGDGAMRRRVMTTPLLYSLFGSTGTKTRDFKEFSIASDLCCSGFGFGQHLGNVQSNRRSFICGTTLGFYTTQAKLGEALGLLSSLFLSPRTGSLARGGVAPGEVDAVRDRIKSIALARCSGKIQSVSRRGNSYAVKRAAAASAVPSRVISELLTGITQVEECRRMAEALQDPARAPTMLDTIVGDYNNFCESLTARVAAGAHFWATCEAEDMKAVEGHLRDFERQVAAAVGDKAVQMAAQMLAPLENELDAPFATTPAAAASGAGPAGAGAAGGCGGAPVSESAERSGQSPAAPADELAPLPLRVPLPIDTSFVGMSIPNALNFCDREQQVLRVAAQIVSNEFLHRAVREEGGAYGAGCASNVEGSAGGITMSSYRDPTPEKTAETFGKVGQWLQAPGSITAERVDQSKLRLFAHIDAPQSPDQFGRDRFLYGTTPEMEEATRQALLSVTADEVARVAPRFFEAAAATPAVESDGSGNVPRAHVASLVPQ